MNELPIIDKFIYDKLSADPVVVATVGTRIYSDIAQSRTKFPFVVYQHYLSRRDIMSVSVPAKRVWSEIDYMIKSVTNADSYSGMVDLSDKIDELMQSSRGVAGDGYIEWCIRQFPYRFVETVDGVSYRHLGGVYRFAVSTN